MVRGLGLEIRYFEELPSTQVWLSERIRTGELKAPIAVVAKRQSAGIGSRGNRWEGVKEALMFSVALKVESLPSGMPLVSASLFFGFLLKQILARRGSKVWLKWPNDLYLDEKKIGGIITAKIGESVVAGVGLNLRNSDDSYGSLEPEVPREGLLEEYLSEVAKPQEWKPIFSNYKLEFSLHSDLVFHHGGERVSAREATLCEDGAILFRGEKIYSAR